MTILTILKLRKRRRGKVMEDLKLSLSLALTLEALDVEIAMFSLKMFCTIL